jgi:GH25 family lysozyme M1 (1,4-beta-N-acetylmuramidase)
MPESGRQPMILGVDVHNGYSRIDWGRVAQSGVKFAIVKATQGNDGCDPRAKENIAGCKAAGIYVGAYLFAYPLPESDAKPGRSPEDQARRLYNDVQGLGKLPGELPPALDLEWPPQHERDKGTSKIVNRWEEWGVTAASIVAWAERCVAEMERLWGRPPILYTYPHFAGSLGPHLKSSGLGRCPLWIANYTHPKAWTPPEDVRPIVPAPWDDYTFWQFSADGSPMRIPGIPACPIDRNVFRGDLDGLRRMANIDPEADTLPEGLPSRRPPNVSDLADFRKVYGDYYDDDSEPDPAA